MALFRGRRRHLHHPRRRRSQAPVSGREESRAAGPAAAPQALSRAGARLLFPRAWSLLRLKKEGLSSVEKGRARDLPSAAAFVAGATPSPPRKRERESGG